MPSGRAVVPGFVDSHTHLVFAGERSAEFAARMAGEPYTGGGIATTVAATRAATTDELRAHTARLVERADASGTTTVEIKSGYGLTVADEARLLQVAREFTTETTFLGAHVVPPEYADDRAAYVDLVTRRDAGGVRAARPLGGRLLRRGRVQRRRGPHGPRGRHRRRPDAAAAREPARRGTGSASRRGTGRRERRPLHAPDRRGRRRARGLRRGRDAAARRGVQHARRRTPTRAGSSTPGSRSPSPPTAIRAPRT